MPPNCAASLLFLRRLRLVGDGFGDVFGIFALVRVLIVLLAGGAGQCNYPAAFLQAHSMDTAAVAALHRDLLAGDADDDAVIGNDAIISIMYSVKLARAFGRGTGFAIGLIFLPPIFMLILGFGDDRYYGADK